MAARLHPLRTAGTLRPPDERRLYEAIRRILAEAIERRGCSIDDYTAPDGDGSMQERLDVYQRTGEPCPRCGRPIKRIVIGARSTHLLLVVPAPAGRPTGRPGPAILRTMTGGPRRAGGRWTELAGEGSRRADAGRSREGRRASPDRAHEAGRGDAPGGARAGCRPMSILRLAGVTREIGTFVILDAIDAAIALGDRIGLVGPNGAGKTTLLRLAAGRDEPDRGTVHRKRGLSLGLLAQEAHFDAAFMAAPDLRTAVRTGAAHLDRMAARAGRARARRPGRRAGVRRPPARVRGPRRLHAGPAGRGRADRPRASRRDEWAKPPAALSGGEQTRAALARLVIADPDLLLLDEPTNHLDLDALEWLEEHLRRRPGSLLVASHDRAFLDATVTRVWELRDRRLTAFRGDYSAYHRQREERDARAVKDADTQAEQIAREQELVQRYRSHRKFSQDARARGAPRAAPGGAPRRPRTGRKLALPSAALAGERAVALRRDRRPARGPGGRLPARSRRDGRRTDRRRRSRGSSRASRSWPPSAASGSGSSGRTARARRRSCGRSPGDLPPLDGALTFGQRRPARLSRPAPRCGDPGHDRPRRADSTRSR